MQALSSISQYFPLSNETEAFFVVLCIILFAPLLLNRLRIPHIIGMIIAGMLLGEHGFNILVRDNTFETFGKLGLYYIMFLAGLEMNLEDLRKNLDRSIIFAILTFSVPFAMGLYVSVALLHLSWEASTLLSAVLASNTLVSYPIVGRYGLSKENSVVISVGATMISLAIALFVLAGISSASRGETGWGFWLLFLFKCALFVAGVILVFPRLARHFFKSYSDNVMQFVFVLALLCLGAILAGMTGLDGVFGAFLTGLVLNRYIPHISPLMNRIEFVGNALFIPYFLIGVGMLIDVRCLFNGGDTLLIIISVVIVGTLSKWLGALSAQKLFGMKHYERQMMFGLSSAHAAGALAIMMVGRSIAVAPGVYLINDDLMNSVVILILVSCIISSLITEHAARVMVKNDNPIPEEVIRIKERILISLSNPETLSILTHIALMVRNPQHSKLIGLHVSLNNAHLEEQQREGYKILEEAAKTAAAVDVPLTTQSRIGTNIAGAILHAALENDATELIIGLHHKSVKTDSFFGATIKDLVYGTNKQVMIVRCNRPVNTLRRMVVFVPAEAEFESGFYKWLERLCRMGEQLGCQLFFYAPKPSLTRIGRFVEAVHQSLRIQQFETPTWDDFVKTSKLNPDHILVLVSPRRGSVSWKQYFDDLPRDIDSNFEESNLMILYPDEFGDSNETFTFTEPVKANKQEVYSVIRQWIEKKFKKIRE